MRGMYNIKDFLLSTLEQQLKQLLVLQLGKFCQGEIRLE
jgi:hypothetical protein